MAGLAVFQNKKHVRNFALKSPEVSIGRNPRRSLVLQDLTVSRRHAVMHFNESGGYWTIVNASAKNPVKINGRAITDEEVVFDQDQISVGACTLVFSEAPLQDSPEAQPAPKSQKFNEPTEQAL